MIRRVLLALAFLPTVLAAESVPDWRYTVRPGDTLIGIGKTYLANADDWQALQRHNFIVNPYRLVPGTSLRVPIGLLKQQPAPAKTVAVSGQVAVTLPGLSSTALTAGTVLPAGTAIRAQGNGSAVIEFADRSRLFVRPNSSLSLDTLSVYAGGGMADTRVRLQQGRAELSANPRKQPGQRLEVITPSAVAAVRGTVFRVSADGSVTREETLEGQVGVAAAGQEVTVAMAQGTVAEKGKPPRPPVALLGAPDVSALPAKFDRYPLRFPLPPLKGAEGWLGQVAPDASFNAILLEQTSAGPMLAFAELPDGKYVLRLRGIDSLGLQVQDGEHAFEVDAHPLPPLLSGPVNQGKVRVAQPRLDWIQAMEARRYRIQLSRDDAFRQILVEQELDVTSYQSPPLQEGEHFWRVASIDADKEQGPYSDVRRFTYKPAPAAPDLTGASSLVQGEVLQIDLPPLPSGQKYDVLLSRDAAQKQIVWQGMPDGLKLSIPRLEAGSYHLAARGVEADGTAGPFGRHVVEVPQQPWWPYLFLLTPLLLP